MTTSVGAIVDLLAQTPAPPADPASGPTVVITLAVITLAGTALTAMAPTLLELVKRRPAAPAASNDAGDPPDAPLTPPPLPAPPLPTEPTQASSDMIASAQQGLSMVEAAVLDYRSQRDAAQRRYDRAMYERDEARGIVAQQDVYIAQLEAQLGTRRGRHEYRQQSGWNQ